MIQKLASLLSTPVNTDQKERPLLNRGSKLWFSEGIAAYNPPKKLLEKSCSVQAACLKSENIFCVFQQLPALWQFQVVLQFSFEAFSFLFFSYSTAYKGPLSAFKKDKGLHESQLFSKE